MIVTVMHLWYMAVTVMWLLFGSTGETAMYFGTLLGVVVGVSVILFNNGVYSLRKG